MKAASLKDIKNELKFKSKEDLLELCLKMSKFKKENKELMTYLIFEANDENGYIEEIKREISNQFLEINSASYYYVMKGVRKVLRSAKKFIRYSKQKQTEIEVLFHFCGLLKEVASMHHHNISLISIYEKQLEMIQKKINMLHEDLQYDYNLMLEELED